MTTNEIMTILGNETVEDITGRILKNEFSLSDLTCAYYDFRDKTRQNNMIEGSILSKDTKNCFYRFDDNLISSLQRKVGVVMDLVGMARN